MLSALQASALAWCDARKRVGRDAWFAQLRAQYEAKRNFVDKLPDRRGGAGAG
jgi:hypothetical protein